MLCLKQNEREKEKKNEILKENDDSVFQLNHDIAYSYHIHNLNNVQILFSFIHTLETPLN